MTDRRKFLKASAVAGGAAMGQALISTSAVAAAGPGSTTNRNPRPEMAKGLTVLNYFDGTAVKLGVKTERGILQVAKAAARLRMTAPVSTDDVLQRGDQGLMKVVAAATAGGRKEWFMAEDKVDFAPAVTNPEKILCVGLNYAKHAKETGAPVPPVPILFNKFNNSLNSHNGIVKVSGLSSTRFDYEAELVIVMGRQAANVSETEALSYVFGYATGNDFTEREMQLRTGQWMIGKTSDGFGLVGPYIVCADVVGNPHTLKIEQYVNGQVRQSSNTNDMIFNCAQLVSYASRYLTLQPGDIIYTGTPEGVIQGYPKEKQVWLKPGDVLETRIEKLGNLKCTLA